MSEVTLNFKYKFPEDYNPIYINGAFGGASPKGEIVANFFLERQAIPYVETTKLNKQGEEIEFEETSLSEPSEVNVVRYVSTGVVMNFETAKSLHAWLGLHIKQLELEGRDRNDHDTAR